jgi:hypothetical protein
LPQKPGVRAKQSGGGVVVVVEDVVVDVLLVVLDVDVLDVVEVDVVELVVDEVVELVEVVVLVVVVVGGMMATEMVLKMLKGSKKPSSSTPEPVTDAVALVTPLGITHGKGPKTATALSAGMLASVTKFVQSAFGGVAGSPVGVGQQKSAVTCNVLQPTWQPGAPGVQPGGSTERSVTITVKKTVSPGAAMSVERLIDSSSRFALQFAGVCPKTPRGTSSTSAPKNSVHFFPVIT